MPKPRGCSPNKAWTSGWSAAPAKRRWPQEIVAAGGPRVRDLTGTDLRNGILAMAAASVAISNNSGLMHIAAALGTPTMGIFGPTSPYLWAPLNGLAATVSRPRRSSPASPASAPVCTMNDHRCMRDISATEVVEHRATRAERGRRTRRINDWQRLRACSAVTTKSR